MKGQSLALFLLVGCGHTPPEEPEAPPPAVQTQVPRTVASEPAAPEFPSEFLSVEITAGGVMIDAKAVVAVPAPDKRADGFEVSKKAHGPTDLVVVPIADAVKRSTSKGKGAASISVDGSVPYRIFFETMYSLQQNDVRLFELRLTTDPAKRVPVRVRRLARLVDDEKKLDLTVLLRPEGFTLTTASGPIGPGCASGSGVTLSRGKGADMDIPGLQACAHKLVAGYQGDRSVTLRPAAATPMGEVFQVVTTLAGIFPDVALGP